MYLSDHDIEGRLEELAIVTSSPSHPFRPDDQIQPSSIDLRIDARFWTSKVRHFGKRGAIDLRRRSFNEAAPRRGWKEIILREGETHSLKPGELLLARTYESFSIPTDLAGQIAARSSYSRMGLLVHCGGDFINPGWSGHMPLQLVNLSKRTLRITPYLPVVQLLLVPLTSTPRRAYDDVGRRNKYANDDGGPSYWWRDRLMETVAAKFGESVLPEPFAEPLAKLLATNTLDEDVVSRLESFVDSQKIEDLSSWSEFIRRFTRVESRRDTTSKWARRTPFGILAAGVAWFLPLLFQAWSPEKVASIVLCAISVLLLIISRLSPANQKLTPKLLVKLRQTASGGF